MGDAILLRPDDVARRLNLSRSKVYNMLKSGELPCVRLGRSIRIPVDELTEWLAGTGKTPAVVRAYAPDVDVEKLLTDLELWHLRRGATTREIAPRLVRAAESLKRANPLIRHIAREELLRTLTAAGVRSPARMLALAFGDHPSR